MLCSSNKISSPESDSLPGWDFCTKILLLTSTRGGCCFLKKFASGYHRIFWLHLRDSTSSWKLTGPEPQKHRLDTAQAKGRLVLRDCFLEKLFITSGHPQTELEKNATKDNLQPFKVYKAPKRSFVSKLVWATSGRLVHGHKRHTSSLHFSGKRPK